MTDSVYNYDYLIVTGADSGVSSIVKIDENLNWIRGGANFAQTQNNGISYWAFHISTISTDGKTLTLTRSGYGYSSTYWAGDYNITEITGIKY